jgi:urate oxidase
MAISPITPELIEQAARFEKPAIHLRFILLRHSLTYEDAAGIPTFIKEKYSAEFVQKLLDKAKEITDALVTVSAIVWTRLRKPDKRENPKQWMEDFDVCKNMVEKAMALVCEFDKEERFMTIESEVTRMREEAEIKILEASNSKI